MTGRAAKNPRRDIMTIEYLKELPEFRSLKGICFERFYRNIALKLSCEETITDEYAEQLCRTGYIELDNDESMEWKGVMPAVFFEPDSSMILWFLQCTRKGKKSLLASINSYIAQIAMITRGGINTYKRNGWDVHVLYVYQLVNYNFSQDVIPMAYKWDFDIQPIIHDFYVTYHKLSKDARFILNIGSFIHDIGVTIAINDHERKGIPLVERFYKELNISEECLKENAIDLKTNEIIKILKVIVGYHQLVNQIAAEVSDKVIFNKIREIKILMDSERLREFFDKDFCEVMYLLAAADVMAVDDSLLSKVKFDEMTESFEYLQSLTKGNEYIRDIKKYGIKRFKCLINDSLKDIEDALLDQLIEDYGIESRDIWNFMYHIQGMSYGVAAIKPLNSVEMALKFVGGLFLLVKEYTNEYENVMINIKADFDNTYIRRLLDQKKVKDISGKMKYQVNKINGIVIIELDLK